MTKIYTNLKIVKSLAKLHKIYYDEKLIENCPCHTCNTYHKHIAWKFKNGHLYTKAEIMHTCNNKIQQEWHAIE